MLKYSEIDQNQRQIDRRIHVSWQTTTKKSLLIFWTASSYVPMIFQEWHQSYLLVILFSAAWLSIIFRNNCMFIWTGVYKYHRIAIVK